MTDMLGYWTLRERPFEATWDTRFFYQGRDHDEALNRLCFLVGEQTMNMGMLTGEIGSGKTLTRAVFAERLDRRRFEVVTQENSNFGFKELLVSLLRELDDLPANTRQSKFALCERLKLVAETIRREGRHLALIFDEAQEMSGTTLNELKLLTNFNGGGQTYLTIILLGQPELRQQVAMLPAINQRISLRFHLNALNLGDAEAYVRHRLMVAGHPTGELFPEEAVAVMFQAAHGIPRQLNRLAKLALEYAWLKEMQHVTLEAVETVVRDLERQKTVVLVA
jgi:general secretion pathway protein A